ncbi:hypothetical protein CK936_34245 [Streptomyces albireticuli]|uniref:Uncharacterized protein n=1 Tax=Streptomyces albireticuli TaxID=1940 RepID=A0A2A2CZA4_9ACTN|nr:hypothetical protein CK936_34245 [Streptomyces albireticuli]
MKATARSPKGKRTETVGTPVRVEPAVAGTTAPVVLEEADLDANIYVVFSEHQNVVRAAYDPAQTPRAMAEAVLRAELGRRHGRPVGAVITVGGVLVLAKLPAGEPIRLTTGADGRTRFVLDTAQVPLTEALRLLQQVRAENGEMDREPVRAGT